MNKSKCNLILLFVIGIYLILVKLTNIRICLIYNLFHIPCPSCGLTRAYFALLNGDILTSFKYNIIAIPIAMAFIIYFIFSFIDDINKTNFLDKFFLKYKYVIVFISFVLVIISWSYNLINYNLY